MNFLYLYIFLNSITHSDGQHSSHQRSLCCMNGGQRRREKKIKTNSLACPTATQGELSRSQIDTIKATIARIHLFGSCSSNIQRDKKTHALRVYNLQFQTRVSPGSLAGGRFCCQYTFESNAGYSDRVFETCSKSLRMKSRICFIPSTLRTE